MPAWALKWDWCSHNMAIVRKTPEQISTDKDELAHLNAMADDEIDYSDIPPLSDEQIAKFKPIKQQATIKIRLNDDEWQKIIAMLDKPAKPHKGMQALFDRGFVCVDN